MTPAAALVIDHANATAHLVPIVARDIWDLPDLRNVRPLATQAKPGDGSPAIRLVRAWQGLDVHATQADMREMDGAGRTWAKGGLAEKDGGVKC